MIDINKKYRTRDGRPVKLAGINKDAKEKEQVSGWVNGYTYCWSIKGKYINLDINHSLDLIEVEKPKPGEVWETEDGQMGFVHNNVHKEGKHVVTWFSGDISFLYRCDTTNWTKLYPND